MGHTLLCVLGLLLLNTLLYGYGEDQYGKPEEVAEDSGFKAILESPAITLFEGDSVILRCKQPTTRNEAKATFFKDRSRLQMYPNHQPAGMAINQVSVSDKGWYKCKFDEGAESESKELKVKEGRRQVTLTPDETIIPVGGRVKLICSLENPTGWTYAWFRRPSEKPPQTETVNDPDRVISHGGSYTCRGQRREPDVFTPESNAVTIQETIPDRPTVTLQPNWLQIYSSEKITLRCEIQGGGNTGWTYEWRTPSSNTPTTHEEYIISSAAESHSGKYSCMGRRGYTLTEWSDAKTLTVLVEKPKPSLTLDLNRGVRTLTCSVKDPADWEYYWFRQTSDSSIARRMRVGIPNKVISVLEAGLYHCRGGRGDPRIFTEDSDTVPIHQTLPNRVVVSLEPKWTHIFKGETITVRCEIQGGKRTEWTYEWIPDYLNTPPTYREYRIGSATASDDGVYQCKGRRDSYSSTEWSNVIRMSVIESYKPKAVLRADNRDIPVGGSVTLTCSVYPSSSSSSSSGWKYFLYRGETPSKPPTTQDVVLLLTRKFSVSQGGLYRCRGRRGEPVYYTDYSDPVHITNNNAKEAVVTLHPIWSEIYKGETITLRCEVKNGGDTEWEYEWKTTSSDKPSKQKEHSIRNVYAFHSGTYWCKGRMKSAERSSTDWSDAITLTVPENNPQPVLTVSPLWLSPGDSVTLKCSVKHPSAGWRFYWYKAVPKLSDSYSYELLPGSTSGTEQDSYIVHGQTHTAGYVCRAGRGDPVFYTLYSEHKFAWSGDVHSSASLTVSPDRVQHFTSDSVSLNCDGNSTEWRVKRFTEQSYLSSCSYWGTMTGSTCNIGSIWHRDTSVYWCESGSGEFSNAVNITTQGQLIILASPVYPVTEGDSVSLSCKLRRNKFASNVFFYRNGELIQNDTRWELNISAVSKSDEGFYKCKDLRQVSPQSWMSVKAGSRSRHEGSSFPVPLIIGLVCGIILLLLLLLYRYRPSKDSCFIRPIQSQSTDRGSATSHVVYQNEAEPNECSSPLNDAADPQDVTYSFVELKNIGKKRKQREPEESVVYADVRTETADNLMYAQVNCQSKGKAKKNNGKSTPKATDEMLYSEIKPGPALGL